MRSRHQSQSNGLRIQVHRGWNESIDRLCRIRVDDKGLNDREAVRSLGTDSSTGRSDRLPGGEVPTRKFRTPKTYLTD